MIKIKSVLNPTRLVWFIHLAGVSNASPRDVGKWSSRSVFDDLPALT